MISGVSVKTFEITDKNRNMMPNFIASSMFADYLISLLGYNQDQSKQQKHQVSALLALCEEDFILTCQRWIFIVKGQKLNTVITSPCKHNITLKHVLHSSQTWWQESHGMRYTNAMLLFNSKYSITKKLHWPCGQGFDFLRSTVFFTNSSLFLNSQRRYDPIVNHN